MRQPRKCHPSGRTRLLAATPPPEDDRGGPAPGIPRDAIKELGALCTRACRQIGCRGLGTFMFLYQGRIVAFIEMNTRVQVEHPVTELVTGIDLLRAQIMVALGQPLPWRQEDIRIHGHALECRINAEHPKPSCPRPAGVRIDMRMTQGDVGPPSYDAMIGKLITHGFDRADALRKMEGALAETVIEGMDISMGHLLRHGYGAGGATLEMKV